MNGPAWEGRPWWLTWDMKVNVYITESDNTHDRVLGAFYSGCPEEKYIRHVSDYEESDVAVVFGVYKKAVAASHMRGEIIARQRIVGRKVVVLETGYVNRGEGKNNHYAVGFNHINGGADFRNEGMPPDRWGRLNTTLKPWHTKDEQEAVILCGQVPWDASVQHMDMVPWLMETAAAIRKVTYRPIIYRPHPKAVHALPSYIPGCRTSVVSLEEDLEKAWATVVYNSNSSVESLIAGVPVVALGPGSMVNGYAATDLNGIEDRCMPDRTPWASDLAYAQWTMNEMREGLAWAHLFR